MIHAGSTFLSLSDRGRAPCPLRSLSRACRANFAIPRSPFVLCPPPKDIRPADAGPGGPGSVRVKLIHPDQFCTLKFNMLTKPVRVVRVKCNIMHMRAHTRARGKFNSSSDSIFTLY